MFPLVKSRDSCQPDQAIEPDCSKRSPNSEEITNSETLVDEDISKDLKRKDERNVFVPVKKSKKVDSKKKMDAAVLESIGLLKEVVNNDTSKDMIRRLREEMDKSREHELKLIQMLNSGGSATQQQQQYVFQSMPNSGNTQYIENGSIANYSQKWYGSGTFAHYMLSQPEMPPASFGPFTPSSNMPSTSAQNFCDGKVYYKL